MQTRLVDAAPRWLLRALALGYLWLLNGTPVVIIAPANYDDALFVRLSRMLHAGKWLGAYDATTLIKGPGFPFFLTLENLAGIPLFVGEGLVLLLALECLRRALQPELGDWAALCVAALVLGNPMTFDVENLRVMREGLYVPCTLLWLSLVALALRRAGEWSRTRAALAAGLGLLLGFYWCIREEGLWVTPSLLLALLFALVLAGRRVGRAGIRVEALCAALAIAGFAVVFGGVELTNRIVYGVGDEVEFKQTEYLAAYGALNRIVQPDAMPHVPITWRALGEAAKASPVLAEIYPHINRGWALPGCEQRGISPCDGEIRAGHLMWALREAVDGSGHYGTATEARAFYARLAADIDRACREHALDCLPPRATMAPPFRTEFIGQTLNLVLRVIGRVAQMDPLNCSLAQSIGEPSGVALMSEWVHATPFPGVERAVTLEGHLLAPGDALPSIAIEGPGGVREASTWLGREGDQVRFETITGCVGPGCELVGRLGDRVLVRLAIPELLQRPKPVDAGPLSLAVARMRDSRDAYSWPALDRARSIFLFVARLGAIYQRVLPWLFAGGMVAWLGLVAVALRKRRLDPALATVTLLLALLLSRIALLSYMDVSSMATITALYLSPCWPLLLSFSGLSLALGVRGLRPRAAPAEQAS